MNIYNTKSGSFELSLNNQSKMQLCKLNESESRPNITLKKIGQELDEAETKCFTLKSELNDYMMGVCRKAQTELKGNKGTPDISLEPITSSSKNPSLKSSEYIGYDNEIMSINKIPNYNIFQRIHNAEQKVKENYDIFNLSPRSAQFSPRKSTDDNDIIEKSENLKEEKQKRLLNIKITPKTQLDKKLSPAITMTPIQNETVEEYIRLQSMLNIKRSIEEELTSKADEDYFRVTSSTTKEDIRDPELNLNISTKARQAEKNKTDDATSKTRKRKGKLRSSISKSTVTTKDTNFIGKKEAKRRRHRGHGVTHQQFSFPRHLKKSNDVVEIFHNTTLKSSNSGMSNKHSKPNRQANHIKKQHLSETANQKIQETLCPENINPEYQSHDKKNEQNHCLPTLTHQSNSEMTPESEKNKEQNKSEKHSNDLYPLAQCKTRQYEHTFDRHNDPIFTPSYEMSTLASRLKRSNRSYFSRLNFRNIPFVVGTSVTPSHNLGLNIQQVLSVMKTRQPTANGITPLLIRKVSRGMRPVSSLLEQMNGHYERSVLDASSLMTEMSNNGESPNINQDKKLPVLNLQHLGEAQSARIPNVSGNTKAISDKDNVSKQFHKEQGDHCDRKIKQHLSSANKTNVKASARNQRGISDNVDDHKTRVLGSHNSKEMRNILINLHDQFEEMNTKYEKLQSEVEKTNDKSLAVELSILEKELNVKEKEINAVVGLYKEVMTLKQEMKMLHEKNSLVCIATESVKEHRENPFPLSVISAKSNAINPTQIFGRKMNYNATREPPTSMQLAALLRQIQTFHKQLQLVS